MNAAEQHTQDVLDDATAALSELSNAVKDLRSHTERVDQSLARYTFTVLVSAAEGLYSPEEFERVGGVPAVRKAVRLLYDKVMADKQLSHYFEGVDMVYLRQQQVKMFLALFGATDYEALDLELVHADYAIPKEDFDKMMSHLAASLDAIGMPFEDAENLMDKVRFYEDDVVNEGE